MKGQPLKAEDALAALARGMVEGIVRMDTVSRETKPTKKAKRATKILNTVVPPRIEPEMRLFDLLAPNEKGIPPPSREDLDGIEGALKRDPDEPPPGFVFKDGVPDEESAKSWMG